MLHVVAGVLLAGDGRVLLSQRPPGSHLAGSWEFPGGKLEPGESAFEALRRELLEELGIVVTQQASPLLTVPWRYGERVLRLETWWIGTWQGEPHSREGQALRWDWPMQVDAEVLAPADRPILDALRAPWIQEEAARLAAASSR